ncbi:MAG: SDR family oxidoreductase [Rhodospirillaceae bacterium]|jgi:uncharacterized protein YbjT (DUF2867 family)|nr:SDR family oxidoreductase [Rhodospirillaceae bacterium]MBT3927963.1 SDR family oxidoreductase [Rhodospirillaceae bacterium]MBT4427173.1 SDR family oxidoreductase [Rhodospirillaceae bacterium]MBT5677292.1 SDR family oxidoreductase [Rhodospirillaceae bacterium]MBT5779371.1 SDR family oxidoreductase [Rhodospirillaceae bacterium]
MILLTGATGTTGQETVRQLLEKNVPFRVMTRDIARAKTVLGPDLDYVAGDFAQPETLAAAFDGITRLSLLCAFAEKMVALELNAVAAAKRAGISHIVKMSAIGSAPDAPTKIRRWHGEIEQRIEREGFAYTNLWPNAFMQNFRRFAPFIKRDGVFYAALGESRVALVDVVDVAAVTVAALTEDGHEEQTYEITGPRAYSYSECAEILSRVLNKTVRFESVSMAASHKALVDAGMPTMLADALIEIDQMFIDGFGAPVTDVVDRVVSRPPRSFEDFARDNIASFT